MRILLQHKQTQLYFKNIESWTADCKEALDFPSSTKAIDFCLQNSFFEVQIVLKFDDQQYDIVLNAPESAKHRKQHRSDPKN
jgi:hypothetical protein